MKNNEIKHDTPTLIGENNDTKEIRKEDIDEVLVSAANAYISLANIVVDKLGVLDILSPVVDPELMASLNLKIEGFSTNLLEAEKRIDELSQDSINVGKALDLIKTLEGDEAIVKQVDLLPDFEKIVYDTGNLFSQISSLSEYFFTNIQAPIESIEMNAKIKHKEMSEFEASIKVEVGIEEEVYTAVPPRGENPFVIPIDEHAYIEEGK